MSRGRFEIPGPAESLAVGDEPFHFFGPHVVLSPANHGGRLGYRREVAPIDQEIREARDEDANRWHDRQTDRSSIRPCRKTRVRGGENRTIMATARPTRGSRS